MEDRDMKYLKLQYEEGAKFVRHWIDGRYKILQFIGFFNAAVLTFGFSENILLDEDNILAGIAISLLSIFVALMGLATEYSVKTYIDGYFGVLRDVERKLNKHNDKIIIKKVGITTKGRASSEGSKFHKYLPVYRAHRLFYLFLLASWIWLLYRQCLIFI